MKSKLLKQHPTIGCCGIDCGLCPRFYTEGKSKCPGCVGIDFYNKHPSCPIITCCFIGKGLETCAECAQLPCEKIIKWDKADSFVTHRKTLINLNHIKEIGTHFFVKQQHIRIKLLNKLLKDYDDGRSKSFYCLAVTLLPIEELKIAMNEIKTIKNKSNDRKQVANISQFKNSKRNVFDKLS